MVDRALKALIRSDNSEEFIRKESASKCTSFLQEDGMRKVRDGLATVEELLRVLFVEAAEDTMACPDCGEGLKGGAVVCPSCERHLQKLCPSCGGISHRSGSFAPTVARSLPGLDPFRNILWYNPNMHSERLSAVAPAPVRQD